MARRPQKRSDQIASAIVVIIVCFSLAFVLLTTSFRLFLRGFDPHNLIPAFGSGIVGLAAVKAGYDKFRQISKR